jgi:threonine dehydratase
MNDMGSTAKTRRLLIENVEQAYQIINPVFLNSPQFESPSLSDLLNLSLTLKVETLNPIRCFKGRGSEVIASSLKEKRKVVCASAGNFGQAMAFSCTGRNIPITVFASVHANPFKVERMRALGAEVVLEGADFDSAKIAAKHYAVKNDALFAEDGLHLGSLEGAGTIGLELCNLKSKPDVLLIPLGNGALYNGVATVIRNFLPQVKLISVQAKGAPAMTESFKSGKIINHDKITTIADGIGVRLPIPESLEDMQGLVDDMILVEESSIHKGMQLIHQHAGLICEPSGAVGLAALLENASTFRNKKVATILCGSNLTATQIKDWLIQD